MYSAVPPPEKDSSVIDNDVINEREDPPRGISQETWKKFQQLKERRIKCCKTSTEKRIKSVKNKVIKSVLDNLRSDEEVAVLRDHGVACQGGKKYKQKSSSHELQNDSSDSSDHGPHSDQMETRHYRNKATKDYEKRWSELQQYIKPNHEVFVPGMSEDYVGSCLKSQSEKKLDSAVKEGKFHKAEELNKQLMQHDFVIKVAQAVECRDYAKRKAVHEEKAQKRKRSKPHWAFEQKARWESKGNM